MDPGVLGLCLVPGEEKNTRDMDRDITPSLAPSPTLLTTPDGILVISNSLADLTFHSFVSDSSLMN